MSSGAKERDELKGKEKLLEAQLGRLFVDPQDPSKGYKDSTHGPAIAAKLQDRLKANQDAQAAISTAIINQETADRGLSQQQEGHWLIDNPWARFVGFSGVCTIAAAGCLFYPRYCVWRHLCTEYKYTERQISFRRLLFGADFPARVPVAQQRLAVRAFQASLLFSMWAKWRRRPPPPNGPSR